MRETRDAVRRWVEETAAATEPADVHWCDGTEDERVALTGRAVAEGVLLPLNQDRLPGCYLARSDPSDVARTEHLTFICTPDRENAGPTNNWMPPAQARTQVGALFRGAMRGRTLYVVPFVMGPVGSDFARVGVQITDSIYVALNMRIMTRMGTVAWDELERLGEFTRCLHSLGDLSPERRYILHFPQDNAVWSIGSGYGGNALLAKKCMALRIASWLGWKDARGWLAEHMLIVGLQSPGGETRYISAAFPSACGKTNLAMLVPPEPYRQRGWRVWTVGDDIAWLRIGGDGRLRAVNPEAGFFGVAPGTSSKTNPNAMATIARNTIYTNVALRPDGTVWWEGHDEPPGPGLLDWRGQPWDPASGRPAAHPNSRFTAPADQCPSISPLRDDPHGVPIDAIVFGARRRRVVPLVCEARSWQHGVFLGATLSSETTAAAVGKLGVLRRDPMAMQPFCGYNMADYWEHWLQMGRRLSSPPRIFRVNWFRTDAGDRYVWPGFGDNLRVLEWILERCAGRGAARESAIGVLPEVDAIDREGLDLSLSDMAALLAVDPVEWNAAAAAQQKYFDTFGERLPAVLRQEHETLVSRVAATNVSV
jgi:phosphoenolpyruvate carboxykinase (GTP)